MVRENLECLTSSSSSNHHRAGGEIPLPPVPSHDARGERAAVTPCHLQRNAGQRSRNVRILLEAEQMEPQSGAVLVPRVLRTNKRIDGLEEEASDYFYLSWNVPDRDPEAALFSEYPPPIALSVRRTTCVK